MPGLTVGKGEVQQMLKLRQDGKSLQEIAAVLDRSPGTVARVLRREQMTTKRLGPWDGLSAEQQEQARRDYQRGYSLLYLKSVYGVQTARLSKEFEGIPVPSQHTTGIERLLDLAAYVLEDYTDGAIGVREAARRFGVHEGTMRVFLQQRGVLKSRGAQPGIENPQSKARQQVDSSDRDSGKYWARRTVELALGRKLPKGWVIHHMNENPRDQRQSNLWLFPSAQLHVAYHQRQSESLAAGGRVAASQTALENGGLWLPQLLAQLASSPETVEQLLSCTPELPTPDRQGFGPV
jgi:transposase